MENNLRSEAYSHDKFDQLFDMITLYREKDTFRRKRARFENHVNPLNYDNNNNM